MHVNGELIVLTERKAGLFVVTGTLARSSILYSRPSCYVTSRRHAATSHRHVTPPRHAATSRRHAVTPSRHRRHVTLPRRLATSHNSTPPRHAVTSCRHVTPSHHAATSHHRVTPPLTGSYAYRAQTTCAWGSVDSRKYCGRPREDGRRRGRRSRNSFGVCSPP